MGFQQRIDIIRAWLTVALTCVLAPFIFDKPASASDWIYTVRPGDTLWDVSGEYLQDFDLVEALQSLNGVEDPKRLQPGTRLRVPVHWLRVQPAPVRVLHVEGEAQLDNEARLASLTQGMELRAGDAVQTGPNATVTLLFADGSHMVLRANSRLEFDTLRAYGKTGMVDTRARLLRGRAESDVKPIREPAGRFEIWTPAAVSAVRGTQFRIAVDQQTKVTRAEVVEGKVGLTADGAQALLRAGVGNMTAVGAAPQPPRPLLPAPDVSALPDRIKETPFKFTIPRLAQASAYRMQISPAAQPAIVVYDQVLAAPELTSPELPSGKYRLKVRGIAADGLEGHDAEHDFKVKKSLANWPTVLLIVIGLVVAL
ncbi:MAG: FecR domain-containing protein [Pseudomonadota bacterium]